MDRWKIDLIIGIIKIPWLLHGPEIFFEVMENLVRRTLCEFRLLNNSLGKVAHPLRIKKKKKTNFFPKWAEMARLRGNLCPIFSFFLKIT